MITEEQFLDFKCPYCGELNSFPSESAGFVRECLNCMEAVIVPEDGSEVGRKIPIPITTPRLVLRRLSSEDWKDLVEIKSGLEEADLMRWLDAACKAKLTAVDRPFCLGIEVQTDRKIIGYLELELHFADRGFIQGQLNADWKRNVQSQAPVREAVVAALGLCFTGLRMHRVIARCGTSDAEGCQLFADAGMRREGEFVKDYCVGGEWFNTVCFAMLEEEYCEGGSHPIERS